MIERNLRTVSHSKVHVHNNSCQSRRLPSMNSWESSQTDYFFPNNHHVICPYYNGVFYLEECCVNFLGSLCETADGRSAVSQRRALSTVGVWKIRSWRSSATLVGQPNTQLSVSSLSKCNYATPLKGTRSRGKAMSDYFISSEKKRWAIKMPLSFVVKSSSVRPEFQNAHVCINLPPTPDRPAPLLQDPLYCTRQQMTQKSKAFTALVSCFILSWQSIKIKMFSREEEVRYMFHMSSKTWL